MKIATVRAPGQEDCRHRVEIASSTPTVTRTRSARVGTDALSPTQARILDVILEFRSTHAVSPTYSEMRALLGMRKNSQITPLLRCLAERSWLRMIGPGVQRGCVPLRVGVPLYEPQQLKWTRAEARKDGERPPEPEWMDCDPIWKCFPGKPDLAMWVRPGDVEQNVYEHTMIVLLARRRDEAQNVTIKQSDMVAALIGERITLTSALVIDEATVELEPRPGRQPVNPTSTVWGSHVR